MIFNAFGVPIQMTRAGSTRARPIAPLAPIHRGGARPFVPRVPVTVVPVPTPRPTAPRTSAPTVTLHPTSVSPTGAGLVTAPDVPALLPTDTTAALTSAGGDGTVAPPSDAMQAHANLVAAQTGYQKAAGGTSFLGLPIYVWVGGAAIIGVGAWYALRRS